jgi:hypothetical protein
VSEHEWPTTADDGIDRSTSSIPCPDVIWATLLEWVRDPIARTVAPWGLVAMREVASRYETPPPFTNHGRAESADPPCPKNSRRPMQSFDKIRRLTSEAARELALPADVIAASRTGHDSTYAEVIVSVSADSQEPARLLIGVDRAQSDDDGRAALKRALREGMERYHSSQGANDA